jgi:hypothetical protein
MNSQFKYANKRFQTEYLEFWTIDKVQKTVILNSC